jgi:DNA polymerase I - 3''-5'' exonuclease and polymerase domains
VQPQNFPRGEVKDIESFIEWVMTRQYDVIDLFAHPVVVILSMLRSMLTARLDHELIAGDFSAIEARVLNWLAGQEDVCEAFRQYDRAEKKDKPKWDPYRRMAVRMGRAPSPELVTYEGRQAGKAAELGCGFGMGGEKFVSAAWTVYQVRVTREEANEAVRIYRETHPRVKAMWYDTENACIRAVQRPGEVQVFGGRRNLKAVVAGAYLYIILPSGRPLMYAAPSIEPRMTPWGELKDSLHFWGVDPFSKQWTQLGAYGGLLVENIVQAVARDLIAEALLRLEAAGYLPVLSVHDEAVCEVPVGFGSVQDFERLMSEVPTWAEGCPVAAEAWRGFRYRK